MSTIDKKAKIYDILAKVMSEDNEFTEYMRERGFEEICESIRSFEGTEIYNVICVIFRTIQNNAIIDLKICDPDDFQSIAVDQVYAGLFDALQFIVKELGNEENYVKEKTGKRFTGKNMI